MSSPCKKEVRGEHGRTDDRPSEQGAVKNNLEGEKPSGSRLGVKQFREQEGKSAAALARGEGEKELRGEQELRDENAARYRNGEHAFSGKETSRRGAENRLEGGE